MTEEKFCKDCRWYYYKTIAFHEFNYCTSPKNGIDKVSGRINMISCDMNRSAQGHCESIGQNFEPKPVKPSFFSKLFRKT